MVRDRQLALRALLECKALLMQLVGRQSASSQIRPVMIHTGRTISCAAVVLLIVPRSYSWPRMRDFQQLSISKSVETTRRDISSNDVQFSAEKKVMVANFPLH